MPAQTTCKSRATIVADILATTYPDARCELTFTNPFELLVATVLSAQCTDKKVNEVTPELFRRWPTPRALAGAPVDDIAEVIRPLGLQGVKSKRLRALGRSIVDDDDGVVPHTRAGLESLAGVGRKTANVVLGNAFGVPALAVDTHVMRVTTRLGLVNATTPAAAEKTLCSLLPACQWTVFSHRVIAHGRAVCTARRPHCGSCALSTVCPSRASANAT